MIGEINTNQPLFDSGVSAGQPNSLRAFPDKDEDVSVHVNYASLIEKAVQEPEKDAQRVQKARELFLSGKLESPENINEAAKNILKYGI
ncbi:MAG: hypothetical protein JSW47_00570 [Phycisphaerales bacterium]|nr:MAG: hypothetical protein JSW47_00570 [Phycisphaerales bacterium]